MAARKPHSSALRARRKRLGGPKAARASLSIRFKVVATLLMFVFAAVVLEVIARQVGPQIPILRDTDKEAEIMVGHPTRLWTMSEGVRRNAGATATIHSTGLRGHIPQSDRAEGVQRILLLGDSSFFGHGVEDEETLPVRLQRGLEAQGEQVQVINGAIPGYSSEQARALMEDVGWDLEPTLLLVGLLWSDNTWDLFRDGDLMKTAQQFHRNPLARSSFYQMLAGAIDRAKGGQGARIITWTRKSEWPDVGVRRVDVRRYATNLDYLVREAARRGAGVVFIAPANEDMVNPRRPGESFSWSMYFDAQQAVAAHHGVPVVSVLPPFKEAFEESIASSGSGEDAIKTIFLDKMHPTPFGQQLMATAVQEELSEQGWPQAPLAGLAEDPFDVATLPEDSWGQPPGEVHKTLSPHGRLFSQSPPQYR